MKKIGLAILVCGLCACGKPAGLSNEEYNDYKLLGAPKIIYSCTTTKIEPIPTIDPDSACFKIEHPEKKEACLTQERAQRIARQETEIVRNTVVRYNAGVGAGVTYNKLIQDAKSSCADGELKILEGAQ